MRNGKIGVTTENIFPVIKKFLYSDHEIFLRELISNAVDASQKLRTLSSKGEWQGETGDLKVEVEVDTEKRILLDLFKAVISDLRYYLAKSFALTFLYKLIGIDRLDPYLVLNCL